MSLGQLDDAVALVDLTSKSSEKVDLLFSLLTVYTDNRDFENMDKMINRLKIVLKEVSTGKRVESYLKLSDNALKTNKTDRAIRELKNALNIVYRLKLSQDLYYSKISIKYSELNLPTEAIIITKKIKGVKQQAESLLMYSLNSYPDSQPSKELNSRVRRLYLGLSKKYSVK